MGSVCSGAHRWVIFLSILGTLGAKIVTVGSFVAHFGSPWSKRVDNGVTCWSMLGTLGCKMVPSESFIGVFGGPWSKNGANWVPNLRFADFLRLSENVCFPMVKRYMLRVGGARAAPNWCPGDRVLGTRSVAVSTGLRSGVVAIPVAAGGDGQLRGGIL